MGLPGKGIGWLCENLSDLNLFYQPKPTGISIGGHDSEEYFQSLLAIEQKLIAAQIKQVFYEINISCPNTSDGQNLTKHPELLDQLLKKIRAYTQKVIGIKLSPDQSNEDLLTCDQLIKQYDKVYINLGNTQYHSCESVRIR